MKLFCCYTKAHEVLLRDYFQPSLPEGFELRTYFFETEGPGDFLSAEYLACLRFKVERILETLRDNPGEVLVWSDIDVVFLETSAAELEEIFAASGRQILYQRESLDDTKVNGGFFICREGPGVVAFFTEVLRRMEGDAALHDQDAANELLADRPGEFWGLLPSRYCARSHGWPPPRDLAIYHANCTAGEDGVEQKIRQLEELKGLRVPAPETISLLGTRLLVTDYSGLLAWLPVLAARPGPVAIDFSNTQIVTMRRVDPAFRALTETMDYFVPDGMPLIWCLRARGAALRDRVYGPAFLRHALTEETALRHYFLGGSEETLRRLLEQAAIRSGGRFQVVGARHGYFMAGEEREIVEEINRLAPDVIWVGLGTPKQQRWIREHKAELKRGVVLAVGFAFDVNAGTKRDAPAWMQRSGLTWLFRISQEPGRLLGRYLKYNTAFVVLLALEVLRAPFRAAERKPAR